MYKSLRYLIPLTEHDEIVVDLSFGVPGELTEASVHYRAWMDGRWVEVARYDDAHGVPHPHRFWLRAAERSLHPRPSPSAMVEIAKADFKANWVRYRRLMEADRR